MLRDKITEMESSKRTNRHTPNRTQNTEEQSDTEAPPIMKFEMEEAVFAGGDDDTPGGRRSKGLKQNRKRKRDDKKVKKSNSRVKSTKEKDDLP